MIRESSSFLMAKAFVDSALALLPDDHFRANIIIDAYQNGREQGLALNISATRMLIDVPMSDVSIANRCLLQARSYFAEPMEHNGPHSPSRQHLPNNFTLYIAKGRHIDAIVVWAGRGSNQGLPPDATVTAITEPKHLAEIIEYAWMFV